MRPLVQQVKSDMTVRSLFPSTTADEVPLSKVNEWQWMVVVKACNTVNTAVELQWSGEG